MTAERCSRHLKAAAEPDMMDISEKTAVKFIWLCLLLALHITSTDEQERAQVGELAEEVQAVTNESVKVCFADQGYTGDFPAQAAQEAGIELIVVKLPEAKNGLPKRWVVERSFAWTARFRRLARDFERTQNILRGLSFLGLFNFDAA